MNLDGMRNLARVLAALGIATGLALSLHAGPGVLAFGGAGLLLGLAYSLPGLRLASRGLGEIAIALAFGLLPVSGAAWLQTGQLDLDALLLALPISAWVAAVILANEIPDAPSDAATGKRTMAVRLGTWTPALHAMLQVAAFGAVAAAGLKGVVPPWTIGGAALLLAVALGASRRLTGDRRGLASGIRLTLGVHAAGCLVLLVAVANQFAPGA
jgi:1,4-dihydroxy-2-naphthoate octaprenyltransferase